MDFYVCDSIETYNKRFEFNGVDITRLFVDNIYIPESGAFWFKTNYNIIERNINLNKKYLHIHEGLTQFQNMQFDSEPHVVEMKETFYNPKSKCIEIIIPKKIFGSKIIFKKQCLYLGTIIPDRKISVIGEIIYNMGNDTMYFILNYFPQGGMKFHWEEEEEQPTMEQRVKIKLLEEQIIEKETLLSEQL